MIDILIAAVLIAFGVLVLWRVPESQFGDQQTIIVLIIGALCVVAGGWIIIAKAGAAMFVLAKLLGLILMGAGVFLVGLFPGLGGMQREGMTTAGAFIGFVLLIVGFYILFLYW